MNIPFEIFFSMVGVLVGIPVIAYMMRTEIYASIVFFVCGGFILFLGLQTENMISANLPINSTISGLTTTYEFEPILIPLRVNDTEEPNTMGIAIIFVGIIVITIGGLLEYGRR